MRHLTPQLEEELFDHILAFGSLSTALRQPAMPARATVARWCQSDPEFAKRLHAMKVLACDFLVDDMLDIADTEPRVKPDGSIDGGDVAYAKHRTEVRRWIAERVAHVVYGSTSKVQHANADGTGPAFMVVTGVPRPEPNIDDLV
jgi:hypothetical protein